MSPPSSSAEDAPLSPADKEGRFVYLIEFVEPGLLHRPGRAPNERFTMNSPAAQANRAELVVEQAAHIQTITRALNRTPDVTHRFLVTHSGIATRLTPEEAQIVRRLAGVVSIERERIYKANTFRGPSFIGANSIWDGSAVPGGVGTRGQGMVIAVLDTGLDPAHPSFANDAACGHGVGGAPNKLITFLDCASTDPNGLCNGPAPADTDGHGSHTASTAGGNTLGSAAVPPPAPPAPFTEISGVAPCANIRAYRVCPDGCPGADIDAGMNSVLLHGDVAVMNFSISGGTTPWSDNDRRKLDLVEGDVLVAASAGNTSATVIDPVGRVNHRGPWVMTVAASTRDGDFSGSLSASGPGTPPPDTQNLLMDRGSASPLGDPLTNQPIKHFTLQPVEFEGCNPGADGAPPDMATFPPGFFTGAVALIARGNWTFTTKITNAFNAGAAMVVIRNNVAAPVSMDTTGQPNIPAYSMNLDPGVALATFVDANPTTSTVNFALIPSPSDILAGFSLRGPISGTLDDLTKPDITAPGVDIYAAVPGGYGVISGTSMSSPHTAGAAALVRKVQPAWTVSEVKSAMMMTAFNGGTKENGTTPWDADDVGNGRVDLTKAALAGMVMNETFANYLAANPGTGGDPKTLNIPSVRNMSCEPSCSWTRTVRNTLTTPTNWTATGSNITPGFTVTVQPPSFSFSGGLSETQVLTITAVPSNLTVPVAFGQVLLSPAAEGNTPPQQRITVAINGPAPTPTPTPIPTASPTPGGSPTVTPSASPTATSSPGGPTATPTPNPGPAQARNLSTRLLVGTGANVGIGGFIVQGTGPVTVIIRAIGPSLGSLGVPNPLANPVLQLQGDRRRQHRPTTTGELTRNKKSSIPGSRRPMISRQPLWRHLNPGAYTAIMSGNGGGTGVGLVEIFDLSASGATAKLGNISTRAFVSTGGDIVIAGFILGGGPENDPIIIRGIGPSLADAGLSPVLADPTLELRNSNGAVVDSNNDWQDDQAQAAIITAAGLAPANTLESGIAATLPPDAYTALLAGADSGTGLGLVEVYDNPAAGATPGPTGTPGATATPGPTGTPGATATPGATPTPTPGGGGTCTEAFDGVTAPALPAGWTATNPEPGDGVLWTTVTAPNDTAPNSAFVPDQDGISDKVLDSRPVTVSSAAAIMTFRNNFNTEFSDGVFWDGGVLEVSAPGIGGGEFLDVTTPQIGGTITAGGYTGELSGDASNPLSGRMAWAANSNGWIDTVINLGPNLNGQTITLRFRFGSDEAIAAPGWNVDTISITGATCQ